MRTGPGCIGGTCWASGALWHRLRRRADRAAAALPSSLRRSATRGIRASPCPRHAPAPAGAWDRARSARPRARNMQVYGILDAHADFLLARARNRITSRLARRATSPASRAPARGRPAPYPARVAQETPARQPGRPYPPAAAAESFWPAQATVLAAIALQLLLPRATRRGTAVAAAGARGRAADRPLARDPAPARARAHGAPPRRAHDHGDRERRQHLLAGRADATCSCATTSPTVAS